MKKTIILLLLSFSCSYSFAQCDKIFDFKTGSNWTWSNYDKKGKLIGKTIQKVDKFSIDGSSRTAVLSVVAADAKGKQSEPISMEMTCADGVITVDMKKFLPPEYMQDQEMEMSVESDNLEMPQNMTVGDKLKDATVKMKMSGESPMNMDMSVSITNRKVVAEEVLNTSAGKFDCKVLEQTVNTKMMMSMEIKSKEWYTDGVGLVKSETYRKGKLAGYSILTTFTK